MRKSIRTFVFLIVLYSPLSSSAQERVELGFEVGAMGKTPPDWVVPTEGWTAELADEQAVEGSQSLKLRRSADSTSTFGNAMRTLDATPYRGRRVVLRSQMLVQGAGQGQMWLRVDRLGGEMGAFDNMEQRPVVAGGWTEAVIGVVVEDDAELLHVGFMSNGGATVFIDAVRLESASGGPMVALQAPSAPRPLASRGSENLQAASRLLSYIRFFHASDQAVAVIAWDHFSVRVMESAEEALDAEDLVRRFEEAFAPVAPTLQLWVGTPEDAPPVPARPETATAMKAWKHRGVASMPSSHRSPVYSSAIERESIPGQDSADAQIHVVKKLGGGVSCRLPVALYADDKGTIPNCVTSNELNSASDQPTLTPLNRSTRLAGVASAWGVMQHFYPYFDVVATNWDDALGIALAKAAEDTDKLAYLDTLRALVARLHDGHAEVSSRTLAPQSVLPLALQWVGGELAVVGVHPSAADAVSVGDVVVSIDGSASLDCMEKVSRGISAASDGWMRWKSAQRIVLNLPTEDPARITFRRSDGLGYSAILARVHDVPAPSAWKPTVDGAEVGSGIVYFNLIGATAAALNRSMAKLEAARGIVFDLRGYPSDGATTLLGHLVDTPVTSARWILPVVRFPDRERVEWVDLERWSLPPGSPRLKAKIAFLTDGRAISYAESILEIVEYYKLGDIVGSTTAGTNGDVNSFTLPGGYIVSWSGLKVLKHDGSRHHGVGISPTVRVEPTLQGIAAGRDEVLEAAIKVLRTKVDAPDDE